MGLIRPGPAGPRAGHELNVIHRHPVLAAFRAILGGPTIEGQPAFNEDQPAFTHVFVDILSRACESPAIHEARFLALAAVLSNILACAPGAIAATKALMTKARFQAPAELVQESALVFSRAARGPEGLEGTTAFLQKRKPDWASQ